MSNQEYFKLWLKTRDELLSTVKEDERVQALARRGIGLKPQATAVNTVGNIYCRYCAVYNQLCDIYDQMEQPQRREYIRDLIDSLTCRILELKVTLEEVEVFEFTYPDNGMIQLLIEPRDIEIMCPFFYSFETRSVELQYVVDQIFAGNRLGDPEPTPSELERRREEEEEKERLRQEEQEAEIRRKLAMGDEIDEDELIEEEEEEHGPYILGKTGKQRENKMHAVNIQRMERRRKVVFILTKQMNKELALLSEFASQKRRIFSVDDKKAATRYIQRMYRKFMEILRSSHRNLHEKSVLGMIFESYQPVSAKVQLEKVKEVRRKFRRAYYDQWVQENINERSRIMRLRENDIMEDISDEIRQWFTEFYYGTLALDEFPWAGEGGSIVIVKGETMTPAEYQDWVIIETKRLKKLAQNPVTKEQIAEEKKLAKMAKKKEASDLKIKEKKILADYKKQRMKPESDPGVYVRVAKLLNPLNNHLFTYFNQWISVDKHDAALDAIRGFIKDFIVENQFMDIQLQLRPIVDEMMKLEMILLKKSLKTDYHRLGLPVPIVQKRDKPKKKKNPKPDKKPPALYFQKLVDEGIVVKCPPTSLDDFWGDRNYANPDTRAILWYPKFTPPCLGDVVELVRIRCLLTLGSTCSNAIRAQLIVGPKGCGKKTLVYGVASESNSILIDLSPKNIYNKCPGAKGLKLMLNYVMKVARLMQPTVIFIKDADKVFLKQIPEEEREFDLGRISKQLYTSIIKPLKKSDQIMVIGTATQPWLSKKPQLKKAFKDVILVPRTDYASIAFILSKIIMTYHGVQREFDIHSCAEALRGYNIDSIKKGITKVMTANRIIELTFKPLQPIEIVNAVMSYDGACTDEFDYTFYTSWYSSYTPWGQKERDYLAMLESQQDAKEKADKKARKLKMQGG